MRRYNTGWNDGMYALMGGHVEDGENIYDAAVREAQEELGISVKREDLKPLFSMQVSSDHVYFYFGCDQYEGVPKNMEPDQCDDLRFFNTDCLPDNLIAANKKALEMIFGTQEKYLILLVGNNNVKIDQKLTGWLFKHNFIDSFLKI